MKDLVRTASKLQLFVTCRAPGGVLSTCCRFVIPLLYGPTIKSKAQALTTSYMEEAMRGRYQFLDSRSETKIWKRDTVLGLSCTHVRMVALLALLLSNLSPLFDAGNNHCYLLPPPHICFLPCCCCKKIGQAILPVLLGGFPGTELKSQVGFQGGKCRRFVDLGLEPNSNPG